MTIKRCIIKISVKKIQRVKLDIISCNLFKKFIRQCDYVKKENYGTNEWDFKLTYPDTEEADKKDGREGKEKTRSPSRRRMMENKSKRHEVRTERIGSNE